MEEEKKMKRRIKELINSQEDPHCQTIAVDQEDISNLTSASGDQTSVSLCGKAEINGGGDISHPHRYFPPPPPHAHQPPPKKKRNLPGHPDPEAEVIALSPNTLMASHRFVCDVCNKGFQRDQNLQLHRRGHKLPWKLKRGSNKDGVIRKKVYVCPMPTCVHHEASRALGDLSGVRKHYSRKHGEKKWKCEKCSKRYAVMSDWRVHSKTCGTNDYICECGAYFPRKDSFISHREFCDALMEESARLVATANGSTSPTKDLTSPPHLQLAQTPKIFNNMMMMMTPHAFPMKTQADNYLACQTSPWLLLPRHAPHPQTLPPVNLGHYQFYPNINVSSSNHDDYDQDNSNNNLFTLVNPNYPSFGPNEQLLASSYPHISGTALLQKACQIGATSGVGTCKTSTHHHVPSSPTDAFDLNSSSRDQEFGSGFLASLGIGGNKASGLLGHVSAAACSPPADSCFIMDQNMTTMMMNSSGLSSATDGFDDYGLTLLMDPKKLDAHVGKAVLDDGMTARDFLSLRPGPVWLYPLLLNVPATLPETAASEDDTISD